MVVYQQSAVAAARSLPDATFDVLKVVTAFTVAHSITLSLAVTGFVHSPSRLVESGIALTVLLGAVNNLIPIIRERRWMVAFAFGLIHGLGFASVLTDLGAPWLEPRARADRIQCGRGGRSIGHRARVRSVAYGLRATSFYRRAFMPVGAVAIGMQVALYWFAMRATGIVLQ